MSLFNNLGTDGLEQSEDRLGGGRKIFNTDIYPAVVKLAYASKADSGALAVNLVLDLNGEEYREAIYVTNKKGENWFKNQNDPTKKVPLPGFTTIDELCLVTLEKPLSQVATEEKVVKLYDFEAKKEVPKSVDALTELHGKELFVAIQKRLENKQKKEDNEYVPTAETRETNNIVKVFHSPSKLTIPEARNGKTEGEFYDQWLEKNKGQVYDARKIKDGEGGQPANRPAPTAGGTAAPSKSLFGNKK